VAIVALDAPPELQFTGKSVAAAVAREAAGSGFQVLGPDAVEEKLGRARHAELVHCGDDAGCLARGSARLGVDRIVGGRLDRRGGAYHVALVQADAFTGLRLGALEREIPVASRRLHRDAASAAAKMLAGKADAAGILEVVTDVPGADVAVDGFRVGRTPLSLALEPGKHEVKVWREGAVDAQAGWVEVRAGETVQHRPRLYAIPERDRPNTSVAEGHGTAVLLERVP
jgi:hypothetical protein